MRDDRIGHRRLVRLARHWWAAVCDPKSSETERAKRYRAICDALAEMDGGRR